MVSRGVMCRSLNGKKGTAMRSRVSNVCVLICLLVAITGGCVATSGIPDSVALRVFRGTSSEEIHLAGSVAKYLDGRETNIEPSRAQQLYEMINRLVRDVPAGIYRTPWHSAYSLEITSNGRHTVYFLGCSDAVWSPPEPLCKAVALIEDAFPINEASRRRALSEISSRLARVIAKANFEDSTLEYILGFAREYADVPVNVGWDELRAYGVTPELRLRVVDENITVEQLLGRVVAAVNAVACRKTGAAVRAGGVFISSSGKAGGPSHRKGQATGWGSRELAVFHVINFAGGDFAMSVSDDGLLLYGERRKTRLRKFTNRWVDDLRERIRGVRDTVAPGHYRAWYGHEVVLEIPAKGGSRLYVLTTSSTDPNMPEALDELQGAMSDLTKW